MVFLYDMKRSESLKKPDAFRRVYKSGRSRANHLLVMYVRKNECGRNRLGISVSKKVGNSVVRHRLTRLIRESYRLSEDRYDTGYDIVVIARVHAKDCTYFEIDRAMEHLAGMQGILGGKDEAVHD